MKSEKIANLTIYWVEKEEEIPFERNKIGEDEIYVFTQPKDDELCLCLQSFFNRVAMKVNAEGVKESLGRALAEIHACGQLACVYRFLQQHLNGYSYKTGEDRWLIDGGG